MIDEKWLAPIGDEIKTISIDRTKSCLQIPGTVSELTERVAALMPVFLHGHYKFDEKGAILFAPVDMTGCNVERTGVFDYESFADNISVTPVCVRKSGCLFDICIEYDGSLSIQEGLEKEFKIKITNNLHSQQWLECILHLPETWTARPGRALCINLNQRHGGCSVTKSAFSLTPCAIDKGRYDILLEIRSVGRLSKMFLTLPLLVDGEGEAESQDR